ncbi:MAG: MoaD/ThiS family protein [Chloroflexi bacterium]|nr:MoaD/ThiS family protein [Chloroflexota bacterium]
MIRVQVKLFADLRRYRPELGIGESFACEIPEDTTIAGLIDERLGLPRAEVAIVLVNGVQRQDADRLSDGDRIALWSPIAGG